MRSNVFADTYTRARENRESKRGGRILQMNYNAIYIYTSSLLSIRLRPSHGTKRWLVYERRERVEHCATKDFMLNILTTCDRE